MFRPMQSGKFNPAAKSGERFHRHFPGADASHLEGSFAAAEREPIPPRHGSGSFDLSTFDGCYDAAGCTATTVERRGRHHGGA
jgi:hypothetical protein